MWRSTRWILAWMLVMVTSSAVEAATGTYKAKRVLVKKRSADGSEQTVPAVEFTVTSSERFVARARDPVLSVGKLAITDYKWAKGDGHTLIFVCFEPDKLEDDVRAFVQYGEDYLSRTELPRFRLSMIQPL